jgi:hypothetical protein
MTSRLASFLRAFLLRMHGLAKGDGLPPVIEFLRFRGSRGGRFPRSKKDRAMVVVACDSPC